MYGKRLEDKQDALQRSVRFLREQIELCDKRSTVQIVAAVLECAKKYDVLHDLVSDSRDAILQGQDNLRQGQQQLSQKVDKMSERSRIEESAFNSLYSQLEDLEKERKRSDQVEREILKLQQDNYNRSFPVLLAYVYQHLEALLMILIVMQIRLYNYLAVHAPISQQELMILLNSDAAEAAAAVDHYIVLARAIDAGAELSAATFGAAKFTTWLRSTDSHMLFVSPDVPPSKTSPDSFVTAFLTQVLRQFPFAKTLTYFYGQQFSRGSEPTASLVANIVCQLLQAHVFDLSKWNALKTRQDHELSLMSRDLEYLLSLLKHLVLSIPQGTILLLIDDFFYCEQAASAEALYKLISKFSESVQICRGAGEVVFKALIMTLDRTGRTVHQVPQPDILWVSDTGSADSRIGIAGPRQQYTPAFMRDF